MIKNSFKSCQNLVNTIINALTILLPPKAAPKVNYSVSEYQIVMSDRQSRIPILILSFSFFIFTLSFAQEDYKDSIQLLRVMHASELLDPQTKLLSDEERDHFQGLDYFQVDTNSIVVAHFEYNKGKKFKMQTSTDRTPVYRRYGYVYFNWKSESCTLTVYQNIELSKKAEYKDYLFIPFRDGTSGEESYGGGRYLDLRQTSSETMLLDFNLAYNPYCAYSMNYSCPVPPAENTLKVRIEAGEKTPLGH